MAYSADKKPLELTSLTVLATDDTFIVGDTSDTSEVAKSITKADLITDLTASFAVALGADDNYVTDAEKIKLANLSGTNTGDVTVSDSSEIDLTLTGQQISASIVAGSIDETKLDTSVNASLDLADASLQDADIGVNVQAYDADLAAVAALATTGIAVRTGAGTWAIRDMAYPATGLTITNSAGVAGNPTFALANDLAALEALATTGFAQRTGADTWSLVTDLTGSVAAASDTVAGKVELAIASEVNTGTDATRAVTPDALAGSYAGTKSLSVQLFDGATDVTTGDGKAYITIPESLNGMDLIRAQATVVTAGTTGASTVMVHNKTAAVDMLSGAISIASAGTVGTVGTVNTSNDSVATNDVLRIDVDSVSTTAPKGLMVVLEFRLP